MHYSQGCCALSAWREHSRRTQLAVPLRGAQALEVTVLLTAQRLCTAPDDDGELYRSSSCSIEVELASGAFATVCVHFEHLCCVRPHISRLTRPVRTPLASCYELTRVRAAPHMPRAG